MAQNGANLSIPVTQSIPKARKFTPHFLLPVIYILRQTGMEKATSIFLDI
jgi:hypothetical protein